MDAIREANRALIGAQWEKTCDHASAALRQHIGTSDRATALYLHGAASSRLNRFEDGLRDLNEAIRLGNNTAQAYFERGYALLNIGRFDEAERDFSKAIMFNPNLGWAYFNRGWIRMSRHNWNEAILDFSEAIRCQPGSTAAICNRAACYEAQLNYDAALADYDSALLLDPEDAKAHAGRGSVLRARGDLNQLLGPPAPPSGPITFNTSVFDPSLKSSAPTLPAINLNKAQHWTREHELYATAQKAEAMANFEGAIECYSEVLALNLSPQANSVAHMNRGNNYLKMKDEDRALVEYEAAVRDDPGNAGAYVNRGEVLGHRQMHEKAIADYAVALRLNPNQAEAYYNRALEYLKTKDTDAAIHDLDAAIKLKPDLCESYLQRATAYARNGNVAAQRADLETAATFQANCQAIALNSLAWLLATTPDAAIRDGKHAVEIAMQACDRRQWTSASYIDTLAAAYAEVGDFDSAVKFEQMAIARLKADPVLKADLEKRLHLFQSGSPYREEKRNR